MSAPREARPALFRETRDREVENAYRSLAGDAPLDPLATLTSDTPALAAVRYACRSFDRQYCLADPRLGDFIRPSLWHSFGARQLFMTSLLTGLLGSGPAAVATNLVPDLHHFRGSFGAKDVIPLWRDAAATQANITAGVLDSLGAEIGESVLPEDLFAYCYAILSAPAYVERFLEELEVPGPHVPITKNTELFRLAVTLGRQLLWLHAYGERFVPVGVHVGELPQGAARATKAVPSMPADYPTSHAYDPASRELHVGDGIFAPVSAEMRAYSVSGLDVIGSWLDYRMRDGAGRRSSSLDEIRPTAWPAEFTEELVRLLWVIEHTVALHPELDQLLADVVASPCFAATELPEPSSAERAAPAD